MAFCLGITLFILNKIVHDEMDSKEDTYYKAKISISAISIVHYVTWFWVNMMMLYVFSTFGSKTYDETQITEVLKEAF